MQTNTAEDWDSPLQSLNTAVVTVSWSSVPEANQQRKKDLLQERKENPQQGLETKQSPLRFQRADCVNELAAFPQMYECFLPS